MSIAANTMVWLDWLVNVVGWPKCKAWTFIH